MHKISPCGCRGPVLHTSMPQHGGQGTAVQSCEGHVALGCDIFHGCRGRVFAASGRAGVYDWGYPIKPTSYDHTDKRGR